MLALIFLALELTLISDKDELIDWISELGLFLVFMVWFICSYKFTFKLFVWRFLIG